MSKLQIRLKEARKNRGATQTEVMEETGIHLKSLSSYENGTSEPNLDALQRLAGYYGVSIDWLVGNTNNPEIVLEDNERAAADAIRLDDLRSFLRQPFVHNGKLLNSEAKKKLFAMAHLLLDQDN